MMQMMDTPKSSAKVVWTYGAISGVCLGILLLVLLFLRGFGLLLDGLLIIVAFLLVGMLASKQTGHVGTGTLASLVAGLVSGIIFAIGISLLLLTTGQEALRSGLMTPNGHLDPKQAATALKIGLIFIDLFLVLLMIGLGAGFGALGGLIGKNKAKLPPADYPMYPPYSPQPQSQEYPPRQMQPYPPEPRQYPPLPSHYMEYPSQQQMSQTEQPPPPPLPPQYT